MPVDPLSECHLFPAVEMAHHLFNALVKLLVTIATICLLLGFVHYS